jgi:hypothetical protein
MARLFDSDEETKAHDAAREAQRAARKRGDEAEEALKDYEETDARSIALSEALSKTRAGVVPIHYLEHREPGGKWMIEHSPVGDDYVLQLHPLRPTKMTWQDVLLMMIAAVDVIYPDYVRKDWAPPNESYKLKFYTLTLRKVARLPGLPGAIDRTLASLSAVDAWPTPKAP